MRRLEPQAALALPPISQVEVHTDGTGWTVTERRSAARPAASPARPLPAGKRGNAASTASLLSPRPAKAGADFAPSGAATARGVPGERDAPVGEARPDAAAAMAPGSGGVAVGEAAGMSPGPPGQRPANPMKGRAIENWLNRTLGQAGKPEGAAIGVPGKQLQGLAQFGIDVGALEKLGLDAAACERVYRAMFVYSQGLHAVLQEAVGRAKSSSAALLVLWRAFTAVLEHAGQSESQGADSLAALVQRGNEEEKAKIEAQYRDQVTNLQTQTQKLVANRRTLQEELARLREDELRLRSESEMYRSEHEVAMTKYEKEIKLRVDAEVRLLDKTRWAESLLEELEKERRQSLHLSAQLQDEIMAKETALVELDSHRTQVKVLEAQAQAYKQAVMEAAQQKQRHEQTVGQLKQQMERMEKKINELKEQLESEQEASKRLQEQASGQQREMRKLERQCEDESHLRRELQNERDLLREKLDRMDKELTSLNEERRQQQKAFNDLTMAYRTGQIELKRKTEQLERAEKGLEKLQTQHRELLDEHRGLVVEADNLREDVHHLDTQCLKETELRKQLQQEKKQMAGQLQTLQIQLDSLKLALQNTQKELQEVTEQKVNLESIVRDTKSSMQKVDLEHQVELKAHVQKVAMLEKVIADERNERRNLVAETQEVHSKREETMELLKRRDLEIRDLRRQRLEREEEVDRYKVLLKAQEQRNSEQLVTIDKYHAAVANHEAEMRQMQVLLECERAETRRQLQQLEDAYAAARVSLEVRIEQWRFSYEDVLSRLNFNPATRRMQALEAEIQVLQQELREAKEYISVEIEKVKHREEELRMKDQLIQELSTRAAEVEVDRDKWHKQFNAALVSLERESVARNDMEHRCARIAQNTEAFDKMKRELEERIAEGRARIEELLGMLDKPHADASTQVYISVATEESQTDLSYQYLESSARLQQDVGRRERLDALKKASHFVDDAEVARDFIAQIRSSGIPVAQIEMRLEEARGAARLLVAKPPALTATLAPVGQAGTPADTRRSRAGSMLPGAPEPYPLSARPPDGQRPSQGFRSSSAGLKPPSGAPPAGMLQVAQVRSGAAAARAAAAMAD